MVPQQNDVSKILQIFWKCTLCRYTFFIITSFLFSFGGRNVPAESHVDRTEESYVLHDGNVLGQWQRFVKSLVMVVCWNYEHSIH